MNDGPREKAPGMAAMMAIFMLSLGDCRPRGAHGKWYLIGGLINAAIRSQILYTGWRVGGHHIVVSFYYYILSLRMMFLATGSPDAQP